MTTLITEPSASPVAEGMARVHASIAAVAAQDVGSVTGRDVAEVDRAIARLESVKLRMVAAADRQGAGEASGMTGTSAWLAAHTRSWGGKAAADVSLATALEDSLPLTREALAAGAVSTAHAAVIAGASSRLPDALTTAERTRIETALVAQAKHVDPARLRRAARRALLAAERSAEEALTHEDAELRHEESRAEQRVRLTLHDNHDGTLTGHFTVPALAGAILRKTIQQMVSPRRHASTCGVDAGHPGAGGSEGGSGHAFPANRPQRPGALDEPEELYRPHRQAARAPSGEPSSGAASFRQAPADRDWAHEYGAAFVELLEHLPTDHLSGKVAATVVVTIEHDRLREALGAAHLDTGQELSASEARRLACAAGILPAVLDGTSLPLDLGRTRRFFTESQRVALATTYDECCAHGCDRPYSWSELHHEEPWAQGGYTDLDAAVPLCGFHHRRVHDPRYDHHVRTDGRGRKSVALVRRT